ncbi:hypothetical protein [Microbacterium sp. WCS2018Hpa-9]|uniref:hypothetical protein n=1 Tax=Microbacterium sp. WCS2018Hpa-9 TaxID=3073635 RepID=UPI00288A1DE2|nr:hypothetical protein [Microbacterium sp. WCS2018Hpa-9]
MAKLNYKIPVSLARSVLDHEITLSGGGFQMKPLAMKVLFFYVGSILILIWAVGNTFLKHANPFLLIAIVIWWLVATAFLGKYSKTKELNLKSIPALLNYLPKSARRVPTRQDSDPSGFYSVLGIDEIDANGFITWGDGTVGQAYIVVGSASVLVFEQDRISILDRVDAFWRKIDTTVELIWVTTKEPQRVYRQLANLERINRGLEVRDPDLQELMEERYSILRDYVGDSFTSIHQYVLIKADNREAFRKAQVVLQAEAEESSLMMKQLTPLNGNEVQEVLRSVYTGSR